MEEKTNQMTKEFQIGLENVGTQTRTMFEQIMVQRKSLNKEPNTKSLKGMGPSDAKQKSMMTTRATTMFSLSTTIDIITSLIMGDHQLNTLN